MNATENTKELIISLIIQDMRHHQLILKLQEAGLDADMHFLEIIEIVAELMELPEANEQWAEIYLSFMEQSPHYEITHKGEALQSLAEACYQVLTACKSLNVQEQEK